MKSRNFNLQLLLAAAIGSELLYAVIAWPDDLTANIPLYLFCYAVIFCLYWAVAVLFIASFPSDKQNRAGGQKTFGWLSSFFEKQRRERQLTTSQILMIGVLFAVIFRLTLLVGPPSLSDDIYRYIWDGRVSYNGINPYEFAPQAGELTGLRDEQIYPNVNHKDIPTVYPPTLQLLFTGVYALSPTIFGFKMTCLIFDLLLMGLLYLIIKALSLHPTRLLLYAWNPLVITEVAGSGHVDIIGVFFLVLSLFLLMQGRWAASTCMLVLSFLTKFLAGIMLPAKMLLKKENALIILLVFMIGCGLFYLPYAEAGNGLFEGLQTYTEKWRFNSLIFTLIFDAIKAILPDSLITDWMITPYGQSPDAVTLDTRGTDLALLITKIVVLLIFSGVAVTCFLRVKRDYEKEGEIWFFKLALILIGLFILLNPTIHPWYLCWILPFAALSANRAWLLLSGLIVLSYWVVIDYARTGVWNEAPGVMWLEYLPFFALLLYDGLKARLGHFTDSKSAAFFKSKFRRSSP